MPQVISNDGVTATVLGDDGQVHRIAVNGLSPDMQQQLQPAVVGPQGPQQPAPASQPQDYIDAGGVRHVDVLGHVKKFFGGPGAPQIGYALKDNPLQGAANLPPPQVQPPAPTAPQPVTPPSPAEMPMKPEDLDFLGHEQTPKGAKVVGGPYGYGRETAGVEAAAKARAAGDTALEQAYGETRSKLGQISEQEKAQAAENQQKTDSAIATYGQMKDDLANMRVDPGHLWHSMSTGQKVLAAISIGLGAVGGALQHTGGNSAMDIINRAIDHDIDAQRSAMQGKAAALANQVTLVGMYRQRGLDLAQASEMAKMTYLEGAKTWVEQITAGNDRADVLANKDVLIGKIEEQQQARADALGFRDAMLQAKVLNNPEARKTAQAQAIVNDVSNEYFAKIGPGASVTQWFPSDAKQYNDKVDQASKLLRGKLGKLTVDQIKAMFPTPGMSRGRAEAKLQSLAHLLSEGGVGGSELQVSPGGDEGDVE